MSDNNLITKLHKATSLTFDCYGTLVNWERGLVNAYRSLLGDLAIGTADKSLIKAFLDIDIKLIHKPYQSYSDILAAAANSVCSDFGLILSDEDRLRFINSVPSWPLFPETLPALKRLARKYRLAVISNIDDKLLSETLKLFDVSFSAVVTSEQAQSYKPSREIFELALRELGDPPERVIHIAEGLCEAKTARELGMGSIWVRRSKLSDDGSGGQPDLTVSNLMAVVDIVEKLEVDEI